MAVLLKAICLALIAAVLAEPTAEAAITCGTVIADLSPCLPYVRGAGTLSPTCCPGVQRLNNAAQTTPDRQAACNCIKNLAKGIPIPNAAGLPAKCGVNIPYKISPSTDCATVK